MKGRSGGGDSFGQPSPPLIREGILPQHEIRHNSDIFDEIYFSEYDTHSKLSIFIKDRFTAH